MYSTSRDMEMFAWKCALEADTVPGTCSGLYCLATWDQPQQGSAGLHGWV